MHQKKLKIIHVSQFLGIGGLEKIIFNLSIEQKSKGHEVSVYVYDYEQNWVDHFRASGINVITPKIKKKGYDLSLLVQMNKDLFKSDIIHVHDLNPLMYLGPICFYKKITFQKRVKLIQTIHGLSNLIKNNKNKIYQYIFSFFADQIIGVSQGIETFCLKEIKMSIKKFQTIPNGVPVYEKSVTDETRNLKKNHIIQKYNLDEKRPIILSLSRITPLKNQMFLVKAFSLRQNYQLLIAGPDDDKNYGYELKKLATENIKFIGAQELVDDYNLGTDLYVSASTHEGIPVAVLEAIMVESPCLVSDIEGHLILLKHGVNINTFEQNNIESFLKKLDSIFNDYNLAKDYAKLDGKLVKKTFSVKKMANKYFDVYVK